MRTVKPAGLERVRASGVLRIGTTGDYEPFSLEPEYVEANREFVARENLAHVRRFLDLACGTGSTSELLLAASPSAHFAPSALHPVAINPVPLGNAASAGKAISTFSPGASSK
jgi:hypothetical protein